MERFVYNPKYVKLLISMTGKTAQIDELAKSNDINAGHLRNVIDQWSKEGVISKDKSGREYNITLTEKGELISEKLAELREIVNNYTPKPEMTCATCGKKITQDCHSDIPNKPPFYCSEKCYGDAKKLNNAKTDTKKENKGVINESNTK